MVAENIKLEVETPQGEHPLIFRDLLAMELRGIKDVEITNIGNSNIIEISNISPEDAEKIVKKMREMELTVLEN